MKNFTTLAKHTTINCAVSGSINPQYVQFVGGIVGGNNQGSIRNSTNKITIKNTSKGASYYLGGIVGKNAGNVEGNLNLALVIGFSRNGSTMSVNAGGIVGYSVDGDIIGHSV